MPLVRLGQHLARGEYVQARREADRLIHTASLSPNDRAYAYRGGALAEYSLQNLFSALRWAEKAIELATVAENAGLIAALRLDLGEFCFSLGDYHRAHENLVECLAGLPFAPRDEALEAKALLTLGLVLRRRRDYVPALASLEEAAQLSERAGHFQRQVDTLRAMIAIHLETNHPTVARPLIERVSALLRENPDARLWASHLTDLALYHRLLGDISTSTDFCEEALVPGRPGVNDEVLAAASVIAGDNALDVGRYEEACQFASLALEHSLQAKQPYLLNRTAALRRRIHAQTPCSQ